MNSVSLPAAGRIASVLSASLLLLAACGSAAAPSGPTVTVKRGDLVQSVQASGTTVASTQAKLAFKVAGKIADIKVAPGDAVNKGQVLADLDATDQNNAVHQAQAADDAAHASLDMAQARVQQLLDSAKPENIAQARAALDAAQQKLAQTQSGARKEQVQQAQAQLQAAQAKLQALQNGPRPEQIDILQQQISQAKNSLFAAQTSRDGACNKVQPAYVCSAAQAQVDAAQTALDTAQKQFALATAPPTATDLQQAQAAVDQAQAQLNMLQSSTPQDVQAAKDAVTQASAAAQLAAKPYTDADLAAAQAGIKQAQAQVAQADAALDTAKSALGETQLKAPVDGKVLQVNTAVGEIVSGANLPGTSVPIVLASGGLVVNVGLPEAAFARVKAGQDVDVSFDSLPGIVYTGKVADLPSAGTPTQNLVSYVVTVKLDKLDDQIHPGMNASATIYTLRKSNVLLVPNLAVQSYQGKHIVMVPQPNGQAKTTDVQIGLSDAQNTEIVSGVSEGDRLLLISKPLNLISLGGNS